MPINLIIALNDDELTRAEMYAHEQGSSLAELVQDYLKMLGPPANKPKLVISPDILALQGSVQLPAGVDDYKAVRLAHLLHKYGA